MRYVFGAEEVEGEPVISMEFSTRGGTLADRLAQGPVPVVEAVDYALQLMDGLKAAHAKGILHRDVKPSNCFLDEGGTSVKIGDFGVSKLLEAPSDLSRTGLFVGTPYYASPDMFVGRNWTSDPTSTPWEPSSTRCSRASGRSRVSPCMSSRAS